MSDEMGPILEEAERRFAQAEVFAEAGEMRSVSFEHNHLKRISARQFCGVGLRVIQEGRIGFASSTDLRQPRRLVEMAAQSVQFGQEAKLELPSPSAPTDVATEDHAVGAVSFEQMVAMGREGLEMSRAASPDYLFHCEVTTVTRTTRLLNSRGLRLQFVKTDMAASVGVQVVGESGLLEVYEFKSWGRPFEKLTDLTEAALVKMQQASVLAPAKAEVMPVLFTPKGLENLLAPILTALSGKLVYKGASRLAGRVGEKILDERLTIRDDATIPHAPRSAPADGEGVPTRPLPLIEQGVLRSYLLDLQTAGLLGLATTGHGYRSYASQPAPAPSNIIIAPGADAYADMVGSLKRGLIADQTLGAGQSNTLAGEFSVNVSLGLLVEDGRVRGRAKDCMIAGNVYELLAKLEGISRERQWLGPDHVPALCVSGLKLAAAG